MASFGQLQLRDQPGKSLFAKQTQFAKRETFLEPKKTLASAPFFLIQRDPTTGECMHSNA
jgi:hypothetical protein